MHFLTFHYDYPTVQKLQWQSLPIATLRVGDCTPPLNKVLISNGCCCHTPKETNNIQAVHALENFKENDECSHFMALHDVSCIFKLRFR